MNLTQAWSLRETDLYSYQRQLDRIDESRVDGNFLDAEGKPADLHSQRVIISLSHLHHTLLTPGLTDAALPSSQELLIHLSLHCLIRARIGSPATHLQSTSHTQTLSSRGQALGWCRFSSRAVPIQHEGLFYLPCVSCYKSILTSI
jgi:hypothetical protein